MKKQTTTPAPLSPLLVDFGLRGPAAVTRGRATDEDKARLRQLMTGGTDAIASLWREHEPYLRAEAQRLGVKPPLGQRYYFAEGIAGRCR